MRFHGITAFIAALATTTASAVIAKQPQPDFELLRYRLPATGVTAKLSLTLERCDSTGMTVSGESSLAAEAGAAPETFSLTTRQLESARVKRSLALTLHDTGTIATIESAAEDRTGSIFGNVIKFVAGVAGAFLGRPLAPGAAGGGKKTLCSEGVAKALTRVAAIETALAAWRGDDPVPADPKDAGEQSKAIDRLAAERAALRVGILHMDLSAELDLATLKEDGKAWTASTAFDTKPLARAWLANPKTPPAITASWTVALPNDTPVPAVAAQPAALCQSKLDAMGGQGICFATPIQAAFGAKIKFTSNVNVLNDAELAAKGAFPMPQWGTLRVLSLSAGFGSNREASMTLDKFGRVSAAKWTSAARAENATAALAGIAGQAGAIAAANSETARQKGEIDALTTQQTLNRLRACREILDAGGSACPAEAKTAEEQ